MTNQDVPFSDDNEKTAITKSSIYCLGRFISHVTSIKLWKKKQSQ